MRNADCRRAHERADELPQRAPAAGLGHPRRHDRAGGAQLRSDSYFPNLLLERRRHAARPRRTQPEDSTRADDPTGGGAGAAWDTRSTSMNLPPCRCGPRPFRPAQGLALRRQRRRRRPPVVARSGQEPLRPRTVAPCAPPTALIQGVSEAA